MSLQMEHKLYPGNVKSKNSIYPRKQSRTSESIRVKSTIPIERHKVFKWYGWGYTDTSFVLVNGLPAFTGDRYVISGHTFPKLAKYVEKKLGISVQGSMTPERVGMPKDDEFPASKIKQEEIDALTDIGITVSTKTIDRLIRSCGQGGAIHSLIYKYVKRIPDAVVWPTCHEEVEKIVQTADRMNIVIIPFGGGTTVSGGLECSAKETRSILSLDLTQMNEILSIDRESLTVTCEAGVIGQDLDRELEKLGYTVGHTPDSMEFSTLGGWIATRASGMKKNTYGNIEDIVVGMKMITTRGLLEKKCSAPRISCGPDLNHLILGSEGVFGVITEAMVKIKPLPEIVHYGALMFPYFDIGFDFLREVARKKLQPSSIRLLDEEHVKLGLSLHPEKTAFEEAVHDIKIFFITHLKSFDPEKMCMVVMVFDGDKAEVFAHEKKLNAMAAKFRGIPAGSSSGKNGYLMTNVIAYMRDFIIQLYIVGDTFETSVSWDKAKELIEKSREALLLEALKLGVSQGSVMFRIAQTYDSGCCIYGYYGFPLPANVEFLPLFHKMNHILRSTIIASGGSISHHHGVGKSRSKFYEQYISPTGAGVLRAAKRELDPNNIFAAGNLLPDFHIPEPGSTSKL